MTESITIAAIAPPGSPLSSVVVDAAPAHCCCCSGGAVGIGIGVGVDAVSDDGIGCIVNVHGCGAGVAVLVSGAGVTVCAEHPAVVSTACGATTGDTPQLFMQKREPVKPEAPLM